MGAEKGFLVAGHVERGRWHGESKTRADSQSGLRQSMVLKKRKTRMMLMKR